MRTRAMLTVLLTLTASPLFGLHAQALNADSTNALLLRLIHERGKAFRASDTTAYRRLVDPAMVYIDDDGSRRTADEYITNFAAAAKTSENAHPGRGHIDSLHVLRAGDMAFVDYLAVNSQSYGSGQFTSPYRVLETFVRREGRWLLLRHAETHAVVMPARVAVDSSLLAGYVGRYEWWPGYIDTITRVGNQLYDQGSNEQQVVLNIAATPESFFIAGNPSLLVFVRDTTGHVVGYVLHWPDGQVTRARRLH
jgi:ketosteroid isomerase-like protein